MTEPIGWNHPDAAAYYEEFCREHGRYREANRALVEHARIGPDHAVLDLAAGTGRTAEAALAFLGPGGAIVCCEPAAAMREAGEVRLQGKMVRWVTRWPEPPAHFDRVLCGAAIWQMLPLEDTFTRIAELLAPGGLFCFNIPALYLGAPDEPGGGDDPWLCHLAGFLAEGRVSLADVSPPLCRDGVERALHAAGFESSSWSFRLRVSQECMRDWLKIPVLTDALLSGYDAHARARLIDEAYEKVDHASWRWEAWSGWTASLAPPERHSS